MSTIRHRAIRQAGYLVILVVVGYAGLAVFQNGGEPANDVPGRFDAIGDSITLGDPIRFRVDANGAVATTNLQFHGWPGVLASMLAPATGADVYVSNFGKPGARVETIVAEYPRTFFSTKDRSDDVLLLIGSNDSHPEVRTPSGLGCSGSSCDGTYGGALRTLVNNLLSNGRETVYVGLLPPIWGNLNREIFADPLADDATRNNLVREYNRVITEEITAMPGVLPGPDLFACFLTPEINRFSLYNDALHPNKLGQVYIAALWYQAVNESDSGESAGSCNRPIYLLESLDSYRYGHKQDLLATGDPYYVDETHVLLTVPAELAAGIWVKQKNAHRNNRQNNFLSFDAGTGPVTVYIAFDPTGSPPVSTTHEFAPVTLSSRLTVSDPAVESFDTVAAVDVTGEVRIGGTGSGQGQGGQQAYLVIVVP